MGNTIIPLGNGGDESASRWMKAQGIAIDSEHFRKVANAKDIDRRTQYSDKPIRQPGSAKTIL
ncbi:MAG: hypothetical protein V7L00_31200 [Nostoc sp.]|uniref:hypothetical protein n=1 Tax=Nostoc sp. TaxID=1180 RepID=UPI002FF9FF8D